jgi:hypothetical protein
LLLIGGAVLIATITLIILLSSAGPGGGILGNSIDAYQNQITLNQAFGGGNPFCGDSSCNGTETLASCPSDCADTNPPVSLILSLGSYDKLITMEYSSVDTEGNNPITYTIIGSADSMAIDLITVANFSIVNPVFIISPTSILPPQFSAYSIKSNQLSIAGVMNGTTYYFRMRACDSVGNCSLTPTQGIPPLHKTVTTTVGLFETVYDWTTQKCNNDSLDLPDNPARFFKSGSGITLVAANAPNVYVTKAADFSAASLLTGHVCTAPALASTNNLEAYSFDNYEWIFSTYKEGGTVHAIIHNEYHDGTNYSTPNPCTPGDPSPSNPCWYNTLTYASSSNEGLTFTQSASPQSKLIAAAPDPWDYTKISGPPFPAGHFFYGYQASTNIVKKDGYYYTMFIRETDPNKAIGTQSGNCLIRTDNLSNPSSWRAWDGKNFTLTMNAPYAAGDPQSTGVLPCAFISKNVADFFAPRGLTFNTHLGQYLLIGEGVGSNGCGFYYSLSPDLITWSQPYFLMAAKMQYGPCWTADPTNTGLTPYPTLVDHTEISNPADPNFEITGKNVYVYYSRWMSDTTTEVDLRRNPVSFT